MPLLKYVAYGATAYIGQKMVPNEWSNNLHEFELIETTSGSLLNSKLLKCLAWKEKILSSSALSFWENKLILW